MKKLLLLLFLALSIPSFSQEEEIIFDFSEILDSPDPPMNPKYISDEEKEGVIFDFSNAFKGSQQDVEL